MIEGFLEVVHAAYAGDAWSTLRRGVGAQLAAALEAELRSVDRGAGVAPRELLLACSRRTSVLPFQIIQALALRRLPPAGAERGDAAR